MALYLGSNKVKLNLNDIIYSLNIFTGNTLLNGIMMLSSDNYVLKDSNELFLTAKESE